MYLTQHYRVLLSVHSIQASQPAIGSLWDNKNWYLDGPLISIGERASQWFEIEKAIRKSKIVKLYIFIFSKNVDDVCNIFLKITLQVTNQRHASFGQVAINVEFFYMFISLTTKIVNINQNSIAMPISKFVVLSKIEMTQKIFVRNSNIFSSWKSL